MRSYQCMGQELGRFAVDFGSVEEVKDILLASNQLFAAEHTFTAANADNRFTPEDPSSIFHGRNYQLAPVSLFNDGLNLYQGFIRSVTPDHASRTVKIVTQNAFTVAANFFVNLTTTGNPAAIIRTILTQAGLSNYIDPISFTGALGGFAAAGATIGVNYVTTGAVNSSEGPSGTTALSAIQSICALCGLDCFVSAGLIRLYAFRPYTGNFSGVKWQITPANAYDFSTLEDAYQNLSNSVNIGYAASGNYYTLNQASINANAVGLGAFPRTVAAKGSTQPGEINTQFDGITGNSITVPNLTSAQYFGKQFLARGSTLRHQGTLVGGPPLLQAKIGDRCTVLAPNWGPKAKAFEILQTTTRIDSDSVSLLVATI